MSTSEANRSVLESISYILLPLLYDPRADILAPQHSLWDGKAAGLSRSSSDFASFQQPLAPSNGSAEKGVLHVFNII